VIESVSAASVRVMHESRMEVFIMPVTTQTPGEPPGEPPRHEVIYNRDNRDDRVTAGDRPAEVAHQEKISSAALTGGSSLELIGGGAAVVLAIIGLAGYLPLYMTSIAVIAVGAALLAHGAAVTARWTDTMRRAAADRSEQLEITGGVGSELLGGATAIALGILALTDVIPLVLLPVAAIVVGGTILLGAPAHPPIARLAPDRDRRMAQITHDAIAGASGAMVLAGLGAIVLGILALLRIGPVYTLVQVAMLAVGGALLVGGSALTARFARRLHPIA
jgi:hypothetical protein